MAMKISMVLRNGEKVQGAITTKTSGERAPSEAHHADGECGMKIPSWPGATTTRKHRGIRSL